MAAGVEIGVCLAAPGNVRAKCKVIVTRGLGVDRLDGAGADPGRAGRRLIGWPCQARVLADTEVVGAPTNRVAPG
jgi:hypothetical protein